MTNITAFLIAVVQFFAIIFNGGVGGILPDVGISSCLEDSMRCAVRAEKLADSYLNNCFMYQPKRLIMNVGWLDTSTSCWSYSGLISLCVKMSRLDISYLSECFQAVEGLRYYRHLNSDGSFGGYAVNRAEVQDGADGEVAYDDNMWLCRDLTQLYMLTKNEKYLSLAVEIADYIIQDGYTDLEPEFLRSYGFTVPDSIGGFYWDYRHDALHTCSNAPAVQCLAQLYKITDNEIYLECAKKTYAFLKCLEAPNGVFYDLMALNKDSEGTPVSVMGLSEEYYSYNSGSPITAAVALYEITEDNALLEDASYWAESAYTYFAKDSEVGVKQYPDTNVWFNLVLLNGFCALSPYDERCDEYIDSFLRSIDYAYDNFRAVRAEKFGGTFLPCNWTEGFSGVWETDYNSLNISATAEIYATLSLALGCSDYFTA